MDFLQAGVTMVDDAIFSLNSALCVWKLALFSNESSHYAVTSRFRKHEASFGGWAQAAAAAAWIALELYYINTPCPEDKGTP